MRTVRLLVSLLALLACACCLAQDVYTEDFSGPEATGWSPVNGGHSWRVRDGQYVLDATGWSRYQSLAPVMMQDGTISVTATPLAESTQQPPWASFGVVVRYTDSAHCTLVRFGAYNGVSVMRWSDGERTIEAIGTLDAEVGRAYQVRVQVQGATLRTFLDGQELQAMDIGEVDGPSRVGLYTETPTAFDDFRVEGAVQPPPPASEVITGTPKLSLELAAFQPDPLQPGEAIPVRGQAHLYLRNSGDDAAILEGLTWDGDDAAALVRSGRLAWYHQHPHRIEPSEVGRVTVRVQGISEQQALALMADPGATLRAPVVLRHRNAEPLECEAALDGAGEPLQINMLTFGPDLRTIHAYLQANRPEGAAYHISKVEVNGRDVTAGAEFGSRTVGADVVPIRIALAEPLTWGRYVTVTVATEESAGCGHCVRAFPSEFPLQVCLFDQVRSDSIEDIYNHCFTCVAPGRAKVLDQMAERGLDLFPFGGGLGQIMQWWRPELPRVVGFWNDELDEHPVGEAIARFDEARTYFRNEGREMPLQMVNLVAPWSGTGIAFMDVIDACCHAYGMAGAANGRDFPLLSSLDWRETRTGRRPWWPYFRGAEVAVSVDPAARTVKGLAPATARVIEPAQERMMTYGCLQLGTKGICHWAYGVQGGNGPVYNTEGPGLRLSMGGLPWPVTRMVRGYEVPEEICRALKDTWDEIGRINAELQTIGPWVANSDVSPGIARVVACTPAEAVNGGPAAQVAALVSGLDTIIVIALNLNLDTDWSGRDPAGIKSYQPVDATVRLDLPEWLDPADVFTVDFTGIEDFPASREGRSLVFDLPQLAVQRIIVVTGNPEVRKQMAATNAEMRKRLAAMETHVPVPITE